MPTNVTKLNKLNAQVGRLLTEWMRMGKEVPEGFKGTLRDYAWLHANVSSDEEIYISADNAPGASWEYSPNEPSNEVDDGATTTLLTVSHIWDPRLSEWIALS